MKVAISADCHLVSNKDTPNRFAALKNVLEQCNSEKIKHLILAGDTFDAKIQDFSDFDNLVKAKKFASITIYIIPGNHDDFLKGGEFTSPNVNLYLEPSIIKLGKLNIALVPYHKEKSMGEAIEGSMEFPQSEKWILVGHGDYLGGATKINPLEPGTYMPLSNRDIARFGPSIVLLGHIHIPSVKGIVYYCGSPCGLDITEKGYRRFLVLDTRTNLVGERTIDSEVIYFDEVMTVFPADDENSHVKKQCENIITGWELQKGDEKKVVVRLKIRGYCSNRKDVSATIRKEFDSFNHYSDIDIDELFVADDEERLYLYEKFQEELGSVALLEGVIEPDADSIAFEALRLIYEN